MLPCAGPGQSGARRHRLGAQGQTQLRQGDVISVASGYVAVEAGTGSLMLSQGSQLEIVSAAEAQVRLVTGETFCQVGDKPVKLQYGEHNATLQNTVLVYRTHGI